MKNTYNEDSAVSVLNDYEESIMFDEDDPDFKPNDDIKLSYQILNLCNKIGENPK
jgi:hypothetical protein